MIQRRVIKIGGSCLAHPHLALFFRQLLADFGDSQNFVIVGGGKCVDAMRDLSSLFGLDQHQMHWRCVRMLRATYEVLAELCPELILIRDSDEFRRAATCPPPGENYLVAVDTFYHPGVSDRSRLPMGWETTTDSIAAFLAAELVAEELCLIKSCSVTTLDPRVLAEAGIVDRAFPTALPPTVALSIKTLT